MVHYNSIILWSQIFNDQNSNALFIKGYGSNFEVNIFQILWATTNKTPT